MDKRSLILIALLPVIIVIIGIAVYNSLITTATLNLAVTPSDATLNLDGRATKAGSLRLTPGSHTVTASRDGFKSKSLTLKLGSSKQDQTIILEPSSSESFREWQLAHPNEAARYEGSVSANMDAQADKLTQDNPILNLLPYAGYDFKIDVGVSQKHPGDPGAMALYITADADAGKTHAQNWIRSQGYDPAKYEIIYQARN